MRRRTTLHALAVPATWFAVDVRAQPRPTTRVAWVSLDEGRAQSPVFAAFRAGMAELGYVEGGNLSIDGYWADGSAARLGQMRADILRSRPDVIVTQGGAALGPMLHESVAQPVVFSMSGDPVEARIVGSYARPGGRVTGISLFAAEMAGKRMQLVQEMLPGARRIAVVANPLHPGAPRELQAAQAAAERLGLATSYYPTRTVAELDTALAEIAMARFDAVLVFSDGLALSVADRIAAFSLRNRLPVVAGWGVFARRGNLLAYGPEFNAVHRRLASYVDRIRNGARPGDLPVEQPTIFELVINLKTARALGMTIPQSLRLRADEVIQ